MIADRAALTIGTRIGAYEVLGWIGAGGMGDVYRACDPRLAREVAIKLIRRTVATDPARVQRFEQEARAVGQLNHPNILAVYDTGIHDGIPFIVSELLEGETLAGRMSDRMLSWRNAVDYASQIAQALGTAHDKGIVHRDVTPANVFLTDDGRIKVLDFGIAKLTHTTDAFPRDGVTVETEAEPVIGTPGYMSPEQVRGERVDGRSDIFSTGAILYEMLHGRAAFTRGSRAETMAAILKDDPPVDTAARIPPALDRIVGRCLEKTREARFRSARDLAFALESLPMTPAAETIAVRSRFRGPMTWWLAGATLALGVSGVIGTTLPWRRPATTTLRLTAELSPGLTLGALSAQFGDAVVLSPDGTTLAFIAQESDDQRPKLYVRRLDQLRAEPLSGTTDPGIPFFSPDSHWIGFAADLKLKKIAINGGAAATLADAPELRGASWADDDTIVFSPDRVAGTRLQRVPAAGGTPEPIAVLAPGELTQQWPQSIRGGSAVLYTSSAVPGIFNSADLVVQVLPDGPRKVILRGGYHGRYLPSGHLVYIHDGTLFATPFDIARLEVTGPPVAVIEGVRSNSITGGAQFSVSGSGTLVYLPGASVGAGIPIDWMDAQAKTTPLRTAPANWANATFSPDGLRLAMDIREVPSGIWVYEVAQDRLTRVTNGRSGETKPVWSPDGGTIAFASAGASQSALNLYWQRADGGGEPQRLTRSTNIQHPGSWHPSGRFLAFEEAISPSNLDVMILPLEGDPGAGWKPGTPKPFVNTAAMEGDPMFSPDGRWLAYVSGESGRPEVYVRPFPGPGGRTRVSNEGGFTPTWSRTSHELFYGFFDGRIMVASYTVSADAFVADKPRLWSDARYQTRGMTRMFDLHPDGVRMALAPATHSPNAARPEKAVFVFNFFDELRRLAASQTR